VELSDVGTFHETVTNKILDDIIAACSPRRCTVVGDFYVAAASRRL